MVSNVTAAPPVAGKLESDAPTSSNSSHTSLEQPVADKRGSTWAATGLGSDHYRPVDTYEGLHRYDPDFEWEPAEERKVIRKVWRLFVCIQKWFSLTVSRSISGYVPSYV